MHLQSLCYAKPVGPIKREKLQWSFNFQGGPMLRPSWSSSVAIALGLSMLLASHTARGAELLLEATADATESDKISDSASVLTRVLHHCERVLPVCQPAVAQNYWLSRSPDVHTVPVVQRVPTMELDPRVSRMVTGLATGFILRTARDIASDPYAIDPTRYYSPAQRNMVGLYSTADLLDELSHPIIGTSSSRLIPRSVVDSDLE